MIDLRHLPNPVPDERLVFCLRRHWLTLVPLALSTFALLGITLGGAWYVTTGIDLPTDSPLFAIIVLAGSIFFLYAWLFLFQYFTDQHLDLWIVTTRRILNIEQVGLFGRTVSELRLYRIQDVTSTVKGMLHTLFNFGYVEIQTAGEQQRFLFEEISDPNHVAKTILELSEIDRREHLDEAVEEFSLAEKKTASQ